MEDLSLALAARLTLAIATPQMTTDDNQASIVKVGYVAYTVIDLLHGRTPLTIEREHPATPKASPPVRTCCHPRYRILRPPPPDLT